MSCSCMSDGSTAFQQVLLITGCGWRRVAQLQGPQGQRGNRFVGSHSNAHVCMLGQVPDRSLLPDDGTRDLSPRQCNPMGSPRLCGGPPEAGVRLRPLADILWHLYRYLSTPLLGPHLAHPCRSCMSDGNRKNWQLCKAAGGGGGDGTFWYLATHEPHSGVAALGPAYWGDSALVPNASNKRKQPNTSARMHVRKNVNRRATL